METSISRASFLVFLTCPRWHPTLRSPRAQRPRTVSLLRRILFAVHDSEQGEGALGPPPYSWYTASRSGLPRANMGIRALRCRVEERAEIRTRRGPVLLLMRHRRGALAGKEVGKLALPATVLQVLLCGGEAEWARDLRGGVGRAGGARGGGHVRHAGGGGGLGRGGRRGRRRGRACMGEEDKEREREREREDLVSAPSSSRSARPL